MGTPDCVHCKTKMKVLFHTNYYCPNDCDRPDLKPKPVGEQRTCSCGGTYTLVNKSGQCTSCRTIWWTVTLV